MSEQRLLAKGSLPILIYRGGRGKEGGGGGCKLFNIHTWIVNIHGSLDIFSSAHGGITKLFLFSFQCSLLFIFSSLNFIFQIRVYKEIKYEWCLILYSLCLGSFISNE